MKKKHGIGIPQTTPGAKLHMAEQYRHRRPHHGSNCLSPLLIPDIYPRPPPDHSPPRPVYLQNTLLATPSGTPLSRHQALSTIGPWRSTGEGRTWRTDREGDSHTRPHHISRLFCQVPFYALQPPPPPPFLQAGCWTRTSNPQTGGGVHCNKKTTLWDHNKPGGCVGPVGGVLAPTAGLGAGLCGSGCAKKRGSMTPSLGGGSLISFLSLLS